MTNGWVVLTLICTAIRSSVPSFLNPTLKYISLFSFCFCQKGFGNPDKALVCTLGWACTCCVAYNALKLLILLSQLAECWGYRCAQI